MKVKPFCVTHLIQTQFVIIIAADNKITSATVYFIISIIIGSKTETIRTRFVNKDEYLREKKMWEDFQKDYLEKEAEYIK